MHYWESCPRITCGDERYNIIRQAGACSQCKEFCPGDSDAGQHKRCFYCQRIEGGAFEDLIPEDEGHHSTICNVPHKKG